MMRPPLVLPSAAKRSALQREDYIVHIWLSRDAIDLPCAAARELCDAASFLECEER